MAYGVVAYFVTMEFLRRAGGIPARLGILPASFNPPTLAHLTLAQAALAADVDEVVLILPRVLPHKSYEGAAFDHRAMMISSVAAGDARISAAASDGGLFTEIARECRVAYGTQTELAFLCGRDAAERVVNWDYGDVTAIDELLDDFQLLVAPRAGRYEPPVHLRHRIRHLDIPRHLQAISATEVRRRVREGLAWEHLVPEIIVPMVRAVYWTPE